MQKTGRFLICDCMLIHKISHGMSDCFISLSRITAVDANDLYDFMVIDSQQRDTGKSSFIGFCIL